MFQSVSHHLQGELTCSLLKPIGFYKATVYGTLVALVYSGYNMLHAVLYVTNLTKSVTIVQVS
jgi:hypothetical protein